MRSGLELLDGMPFDVVVAAMPLPDQTASWVLEPPRALRPEQGGGTPVVVLGGDEDPVREALTTGSYAAYVPTPLNVDDVCHAIETVGWRF